MDGGTINITTSEVLEVIKFVKGGKALSADGIPDTLLNYKTLKEALTKDQKIMPMVEAMERDE